MIEAVLLAATLLSPDTTVILAEERRDLTGDGQLEHLVLRASGDMSDSLAATFTIVAVDDTLYSDAFLIDRFRPLAAPGGSVATDEEWETEILGFYRGFFADSRFSNPRDDVVSLRRTVDVIPWGVDLTIPEWLALLDSGLPSFRYSPGGDRAYSLVWHAPSHRFIDVLQCC